MRVGQSSWPSSLVQLSDLNKLFPLSQVESFACHGLTEGPVDGPLFDPCPPRCQICFLSYLAVPLIPDDLVPFVSSPVRRRHRRPTWALSMTWFVALSCLSPSASRYMSAVAPPSCPHSYHLFPPWHLYVTTYRTAGVVLSYCVVLNTHRRNFPRATTVFACFFPSMILPSILPGLKLHLSHRTK